MTVQETKPASGLEMAMAVVVALAICAAPLVGYHATTGVVLGFIQAVAVMIPILKAPPFVRALVRSHPFIADVVLSVSVAWANAHLFGAGLTLALATCTTGALLSLTLPRV